MPRRPRHQVAAVSLLGGWYEASGWVEIREPLPNANPFEARCKVLGWDHHELTGTMPVPVVLNLAGGGQLKGSAYVDGGRARTLWGEKKSQADLKMHGTEAGFKLRVQ